VIARDGDIVRFGRAAKAALLVLVGLAALAPSPAHAGPDPVPTVTVTPATDLVDAQAVTVEGAGWDTGDDVVITQCEVATDRCSFALAAEVVDAGGAFTSVVRPRTVFLRTKRGSIDCRAVACEVRATSQADEDVSASAPITFDPSAPLLPPPTITVAPAGGIRDGDRVTVTGAQFFYVNDVRFAQCRGGTTDPGRGGCSGIAGVADPDDDGAFVIEISVRAVIGSPGDRTDCRVDPCDVSAAMFPFTRVVAGSTLGFDPDAPLRPPPELEVTPTAGLVDGQTVQVAGSGFHDGESVSVVECRAGAGGEELYEACDVGAGDHVHVAQDGRVETQIAVTDRFDPQTGDIVDCATSGCVVRAQRLADETFVDVTITFAAARDAAAEPIAAAPAFTG
jgi:hypothetical protein